MDEEQEQRDTDALRRDLLARIDMMLQIRQFMGSTVYKRMLADSSAEKDQIMKALVLVDGDTEEGRKEERDLREAFRVANQWQVFFLEYIKEGEDAETQYQLMAQEESDE